MCAHVGTWSCVEASTETRDIESPGVTGSRDLPVMGAGSQTWILCKSSALSYPSPAPETLKARGEPWNPGLWVRRTSDTCLEVTNSSGKLWRSLYFVRVLFMLKLCRQIFFLNFRSIFNLEFSCVCTLPVVGIFFCTSLLDEASKVKECGEHGIEFLELTGLSLYLVNQCLCSVRKNNCIFSYGRKTSQRLWKWLREWSACLGKA